MTFTGQLHREPNPLITKMGTAKRNRASCNFKKSYFKSTSFKKNSKCTKNQTTK